MNEADSAIDEHADQAMPEKISPSQFMRSLRPEHYSDTEDHASYILDSPALEFHLESLTQRNQTHDFELFARKLCERAICPNLRPQTGPEGGGDSKVDSETYPVADEIALTYIGEPNGGRERWAFAFSAKAKWQGKVRADVKGIVETGRPYNRIICVTSRSAKAKDRARIEDQLSKQYGIPVTIHDRSWIIKEVIESDRKDLAFNYLGIGQAKSDPLHLGPTDYSRTRQLTEIEKALANPEAFRGMMGQRVVEALVAAKLSRNLERPRTETDGRFLRAIRLATADGTYRQQLEANYEYIWTSYWWFDDFQFVSDSYVAFEKQALQSDHTKNLTFLSNLLQVLVTSVVHGHMSREDCCLDQRTATLRGALERMAMDADRPNNSLEAQTTLLILRLNATVIEKKVDQLAAIWRDFAAILDKASGLGEFDADRLASIIELAGRIAGSDAEYNDLIEKLATFVAARKSEAEGSLILLKRAQQLDFSERFDMIRLLGKAVIGLTKKEYAGHLIEALQLLSLAYRSAGLPWAARASCLFAAATIVVEGEEDNHVPMSFIPTLKIWAWLALELRHLPDFLFMIQLLNGALMGLPLTEDSKERVREDIRELELALGSVFLNLTDADLAQLETVADVLEPLGLFAARAALLYTLGYTEKLREDRSLPKEETDEAVNRMFSVLASQPVARVARGTMILNGVGGQCLTTTVLGITVEIRFNGALRFVLLAEAVLGSLDAFFATTLEHKVIPHTEKFLIDLAESVDISAPVLNIDTMNLKAVLIWPAALSPTDFERQGEIRRFLAEVSGKVLDATCIVSDVEGVLQKLFDDEAVQQRMAMVVAAGNSYHRVASKWLTRISDFPPAAPTTYPPRSPRPQLTLLDLTRTERDGPKFGGTDSSERPDAPRSGPPRPTSHRAMSIRSVIDARLWDQANWKATAYARFGENGYPPCIAFTFENEGSARSIFARWRDRFGASDENEEIYLAIVRHLPERNPHHYIVLVTSKCSDEEDRDPKSITRITSRSMTMEAVDDTNLEGFLHNYGRVGAYYLMPAVLTDKGTPKLMQELAILKRDMSVKDAATVGENDLEIMALEPRALASYQKKESALADKAD